MRRPRPGRWRSVAYVALIAPALSASACGGTSSPGGPTRAAYAEEAAVGRDSVPAEILGLATHAESIGSLLKKAGRDTFITGARLWSLRDGERLRATLEVARLAPDAEPEEEDFRRSIAQIGSSGSVRWIDGHEVYVRKGNQQSIYLWFSGIHFVVLSVAADFPAPRSLVRAALEVKP